MRHDNKSMFLRPSDESASVERAKPPIRQPRKNELAGNPLRNEPAHCSPHSEMIETCGFKSQDQVWLGKVQRLEEDVLHTESTRSELSQCHMGCESVKTVMNVC